jgi:hypothetical protein
MKVCVNELCYSWQDEEASLAHTIRCSGRDAKSRAAAFDDDGNRCRPSIIEFMALSAPLV